MCSENRTTGHAFGVGGGVAPAQTRGVDAVPPTPSSLSGRYHSAIAHEPLQIVGEQLVALSAFLVDELFGRVLGIRRAVYARAGMDQFSKEMAFFHTSSLR